MTEIATQPASIRNVPVWETPGWQPLPPLVGDATADVCVVGLGGSGLSCIGELRRLGASVVGIDAGSIAGGAAGRNGGFLLAGSYHFYHDAVAAYGRERARAIYHATLAEMDRIAAETPDAVRLVGSLRIAAGDEEVGDCRVQLDAMRADALAVEWYEGPEGVGLLVPTDGAFDPLLRCRTLARRLLADGARLHERSPARFVRGREVHTPAGRVSCGAVIVAIDGRLDELIPELRDRVRTARLQMIATAPLPETRYPRPVYMRYGYEWWQQLPDGRIALGGFRDRGGDPEWTSDAEPCDAVQGMIDEFLRGTLGIDAAITHRWAASVGYTDDGLPVLEQVRPGVWVCGGYSGTGNVIGAICGRAAAQLAVNGKTQVGTMFVAAA